MKKSLVLLGILTASLMAGSAWAQHKAPNDQPPSVFADTLDEIATAITVAEREGKDAQAAAYDPAVLDATTVGRAHDAQCRPRLRAE
jgi:hypothetical protein